MSHASRSQGTYLITEPYDGTHVRVIASGATPEAAERQISRERARRTKAGYTFFSPLRRVISERGDVHGILDREAATLPTWDA